MLNVQKVTGVKLLSPEGQRTINIVIFILNQQVTEFIAFEGLSEEQEAFELAKGMRKFLYPKKDQSLDTKEKPALSVVTEECKEKQDLS